MRNTGTMNEDDFTVKDEESSKPKSGVKGKQAAIKDLFSSTEQLAYIAGFLVFSFKNLIYCEECLHAFQHSDDKCPHKSLILLKDYSQNSEKTCLQMPSGSLCVLLNTAEVVFRKRLHHIHDKLVTEKLTCCTLKEM